MNKPQVSIILPVLNGASYLAQAIASVQAQSFENWELIILDDGSTDSSREIARAMADARCRLDFPSISKPRGVAAVRNRGLALAQGEFIAFIDQDDVWERSKLSLQLDYLAARPTVPAVSCLPKIIWGSAKPEPIMTAWHNSLLHIAQQPDPLVTPLDLLIGCPFPLSGSVVRRDGIDMVGGFDESFSHTSDWLFWACLAHGTGQSLGLLSQELITYRLHDANSIHNLTNDAGQMLQTLFVVTNRLAEWLAQRSDRPLKSIKESLAEQTDFHTSAQVTSVKATDWQAMLKGVEH